MAFVNKMDRVGADFFGVVSEIKEKLGSNPVPLQIPFGAEENFKGIVDLIERRAIVWKEDEALGMKYEYCEIPEELVESVEEWREKLVEAVCVSDDDLLERFLEDRDSISVEEFMAYTRRATINMEIVPVLCGSAFKNKGVQRLLDAITDLMPSPLDIGAVSGTDPKTDKEMFREPDDDEPLTGLDPIAVSTIRTLMRETNDALGLTSIVVTHNVNQMSQLVDYCYIIASAKIAGEGPPEELNSSSEPSVNQFMNGKMEGPIPFHYQTHGTPWGLLD